MEGVDETSFLCEHCGGLFPTSRKESHTLHWCSSSDRDFSDDSDSESPPDRPANSSHITKGWLHNIIDIEFSSVPISLKFEQQSVFSDLGTGGGVWHSELVLAEKCVSDLGEWCTTSSKPPRVLELGCGVAPVAGLVCLAIGCDVLMTDMEIVIGHIEANIRLNHEAIVNSRQLRGRSLNGVLSRSSCDTEALLFGIPLTDRVFSRGPYDLVMCSDCLFRTELHDPLGHTLRELLEQNRDVGNSETIRTPRCIVSFFNREAHYMEFIDRTCPLFGLKASRCKDVQTLYRDVPWCTNMDSALLDSNYHMYDISLVGLSSEVIG